MDFVVYIIVTLLLQWDGNRREYFNEWMWLYSKKTLSMDIENWISYIFHPLWDIILLIFSIILNVSIFYWEQRIYSQQFSSISYSSISYSQHVTYYIPSIYLFYSWKFIPFEHLLPVSLPFTLCFCLPQVWSFFLSFFFKYYIQVRSYSICLSLSNLFRLA